MEGGPVWSQELHSVVLVGLLQLGVFLYICFWLPPSSLLLASSFVWFCPNCDSCLLQNVPSALLFMVAWKMMCLLSLLFLCFKPTVLSVNVFPLQKVSKASIKCCCVALTIEVSVRPLRLEEAEMFWFECKACPDTADTVQYLCCPNENDLSAEVMVNRHLYQNLSSVFCFLFFFLMSTHSTPTLMDFILFCCFLLFLLAFPLTTTLCQTYYQILLLKQSIFKASAIRKDISSEDSSVCCVTLSSLDVILRKALKFCFPKGEGPHDDLIKIWKIVT